MKAVRHIGITIKDLDQAIDFYKSLMGLKIIRRMEESGKFIDYLSGLKKVRVTTVKMATDDGSLIELLYYHSHPRLTGKKKEICAIGLSHLAFTVGDLNKLYKKLINKGIKFNCAPRISKDGKAKVTFCRDPEGNLIELVEELV